jgi:uncharacterized protein (TIGR03086 family)
MTNVNVTKPVPLSAAPFGDDDPRMALGKAVALGSAVIAAVRPDQLTDPTPCAEFDVRSLLGHLVVVLRRVAVVGRGGSPFDVEPPGDVADDGWSDPWRAAAHDVMDVWTDDARLDQVITLPWTTMTGRQALEIYTSEVSVHVWDLARATDQQPAWDDAVVAVALSAFERELPADADRTEAPFDPAVPVPADAPAIDRLVGLTGRDPAWAA